MSHLPECAVPWIRECICVELGMAFERGMIKAANIAISRISDLYACNKNDDCDSMAEGIELALQDIRDYMEQHG